MSLDSPGTIRRTVYTRAVHTRGEWVSEHIKINYVGGTFKKTEYEKPSAQRTLSKRAERCFVYVFSAFLFVFFRSFFSSQIGRPGFGLPREAGS